MINPIDYLYYKVYKGISYMNGGSYPITQVGATGLILIANYMTISYLILGRFPDYFMRISGLFLIAFCIIYFSVREKKILAKYEQESEKSQKIGNWIVICYIIFTCLSFYFVLAP